MGNTVNLGSRVQGLTKYLEMSDIGDAGDSRKNSARVFLARRRCESPRVVNIAEPVDLYEEGGGQAWRRRRGEAFFAESEAALAHMEAGDFVLCVSGRHVAAAIIAVTGFLLLTCCRAPAPP